MPTFAHTLLCLLMLSWTSTAISVSSFETNQQDFLPVEEAFQAVINLTEDHHIEVPWTIAEGYYLYQNRFRVQAQPDTVQLGTMRFSEPSKTKVDEYFGEVAVFDTSMIMQVPVLSAPENFSITVHYQGCAEAGLCYLPEKLQQAFTLENPIHTAAAHPQTRGFNEVTPTSPPVTASSDSTGSSSDPTSTKLTSLDSLTEPSKGNLTSNDSQVEKKLDRHDANSLHAYLLEAGLLPKLLVFFLLGLGLTFTPCVLPMIPILTGVIAGQQQPMTTRKGFLLSSSYVLGMALTFAIIGLIVGLTGARIQVWMQNPVVLTLFALLFVALAFAMFGFYELQLPQRLQDRLNQLQQKQQGGHWISVFLMGALSALVVSPCVSAPLAGALLYVTNAGNPISGALTLFALGLGMGAPLIAIGTTEANFWPKAGGWMDQVKAFFGVLLLAVGAWFIRSVLPDTVMMWIWASLLILPAIYFGALRTANSGLSAVKQGIALIAMLYGAILIVGAAGGSTNPLKPLASLTVAQHSNSATTQAKHLNFTTITTMTQLTDELENAKRIQQPVMLDYYADWCIACIKMEHGAFQDPVVIEALKGVTLLQIDLTNNPEDKALLAKFGIFAPPSILFFDQQGEWLESASVMGEMSAERFLRHLEEQVLDHLVQES